MPLGRLSPSRDLDARRIASLMKALANPVRIELLKLLQSPLSLGEIRLRPHRSDRERQSNRSISRTAVREHLARLLEIGVVAPRRATRDGRTVDQYVVSHRQLFALTEELRQLARLGPENLSLAEATRPTPDPGLEERPSGPRLVSVNGVLEGSVFPLGESGGTRRWVIGRRRGVAICLDYDPFLSGENSELRLEKGEFRVRDFPGCRNGTSVNWEPLPRGGERVLRTGDVIGAGRSLLVFRGD